MAHTPLRTPEPTRSAQSQVGGKPARERTLRAAGRRNVARMLDASLVVFAERGYHAARVDDICAEAAISHGTFYIYFASKDDLFGSLVDEVVASMDELARALPPVEAGAGGLRALRSWLGDFYELYARYFPVIQAWNEANASDADLARRGARVLRSFIDRLVDRVEELASVPVEDPRVASLAMVSMIERSITFALARVVPVDPDELLDNLARILHVGLFGGVRARR
ncbi:MAG: TetR/AcrR family transcriptional regulator [Actinomycetota bacterium]|nr:TetR/AcrR family transcriptional regulator [Actinomycetota bacterium]